MLDWADMRLKAFVLLATGGCFMAPLGVMGPASARVHARQVAQTSVWAGVYTEAQATRGAKAYIELCGSCHGAELEGADAPPLKGDEFLKPWNEKTLDGLFERIRTTMPQEKPGSLSPSQTADVTAYILNVSKFPVGPTELPRAITELRTIRIDMVKPSATP